MSVVQLKTNIFITLVEDSFSEPDLMHLREVWKHCPAHLDLVVDAQLTERELVTLKEKDALVCFSLHELRELLFQSLFDDLALEMVVAVGMPVTRPPPAQIPACGTTAPGSCLGS
jgi:hypothetical protein